MNVTSNWFFNQNNSEHEKNNLSLLTNHLLHETETLENSAFVIKNAC